MCKFLCESERVFFSYFCVRIWHQSTGVYHSGANLLQCTVGFSESLSLSHVVHLQVDRLLDLLNTCVKKCIWDMLLKLRTTQGIFWFLTF